MNTEYAWDRNSLPQANTVSDVPRLIRMVRETIRKFKNGKTARPSGVVPEMIKDSRRSRR